MSERWPPMDHRKEGNLMRNLIHVRLSRFVIGSIDAVPVDGIFAQVAYPSQSRPLSCPFTISPFGPGDGYIWTPGYWAWDGEYYWVPGTWVLAPEAGYLWTPGYWGWAAAGFISTMATGARQ